MSPTETLMLIALGFALAIVLVLLFGRAVWSIAMRLGARRQAKQIPTAMLELQADRDRLRADHAMMSRKLELRLGDIKSRMTEQMAEVSRHRNRVQSMMQDIEQRDETIKTRDHELATLNAQIEVHKADLAAAYDSIEKLTAEAVSKDELITKQTTLIAQISTNLQAKKAQANDLGHELQKELQTTKRVAIPPSAAPVKNEPTENRLMQRVAELTSISSQISNQRESIPFLSNPAAQFDSQSTSQPELEVDTLQASIEQQLADTERESAAMDEQLKAIDEMMNPPAPVIEPETAPKKSGAMANVISLAQRIRALQHGMND
jgi:DNA repair exonuclease SbcCD ATPase subunit